MVIIAVNVQGSIITVNIQGSIITVNVQGSIIAVVQGTFTAIMLLNLAIRVHSYNVDLSL